MEVFSDAVESDEHLDVIGGEVKEDLVFVRFEQQDGEWSKNTEYIESTVNNFHKRLKAPPLRKKNGKV